ncbi:MAG: hypothetical protein AAF515_00655 [Pseudomonadota bacterium]
MSERFKLVFRGEVRDGQHPAVVRKKLAKLMKASDEQLALLFSGKGVTVRKNVTAADAQKYCSAFENAGAILHAVGEDAPAAAAPAVADEPARTQPPAAASTPVTATSAAATQPTDSDSLQVAAAGADLLNTGERPVVQATQVETDHLSLAFPGTDLLDALPEPLPQAPDVSHMSLDALGATLGSGADVPPSPPAPDVDFSLADVGSDMGAAPQDASPAAPDVSHIELAETEGP